VPKRLPLALALAALVATAGYGEDPPDYRALMLRNSLLPGTAQLAMGETLEGIVYLASLPLQLAGLGLVAYQTVRVAADAEVGVFREDGRTYFLRETDSSRSAADQWLFYGGMTLSLYGNLLSAYSQYAAHRDYVDRYGDPLGLAARRHGRETLPELLVAPWLPRYALSEEVLVALALTAAGSMGGGDFARIGDYFQRDTVPFMGAPVTPLAGLALRLATSVLLVTANAVSEEILFRGALLERSGVTASSLSFGLGHLPNALFPGVALEDTLLQTVFALGFGFYAARSTVANGYDFRRMAALHFWNNMLAFTLAYLVDPESQRELSIGFRAAM
jgi:membrane protease YdiL (CAAX protease family)